MFLYMCTGACGFNTAVPLSILYVACTTGLTKTFQTDGFGVEDRLPGLHILPMTPIDFYLWGCMKKKVHATKLQDCNNLINHTEVAAADIIPRQPVSVRGRI
jgi:hypothetical protein